MTAPENGYGFGNGTISIIVSSLVGHRKSWPANQALHTEPRAARVLKSESFTAAR